MNRLLPSSLAVGCPTTSPTQSRPTKTPDDECPPSSPRRPLLPFRCPDSNRKAMPPKTYREPPARKLPLRAVPCAGAQCPGLSSSSRSIHPGPRAVPPAPRCGGARPGRTAPGAGTRARRGGRWRALGDRGGTLSGRGARGGLIQGTCGRAGRAGAAQSATGRARRPTARSPGPRPPRLLPSRRSLASSGRSPGTPSSAGCPRQPPPLPGRLPLVTLSPPPAPQPPTGMENTSRGGGGGGAGGATPL